MLIHIQETNRNHESGFLQKLISHNKKVILSHFTLFSLTTTTKYISKTYIIGLCNGSSTGLRR